MRASRIKHKLSQDEPVLITQLHLLDASLFELTSLMGFDGIWMDMEHHTYSLETATQLMRAARIGASDILARPANGEYMRIGRMLEAGAQGIMYPRCSNAAEAAEVVKWAKFAPLGKRGFDGSGADMPYCTMPVADYVQQANENTFITIQLEEQSAVDQAEEIAAVPGVDALMLGPADFSILQGFPGQFNHPQMQTAIQTIATAAANQGKHWGMPTFNLEHAQQLLQQGARMLYHMADIIFVKNGLEQMQQQFSQIGFSFDNRLTDSATHYMQGKKS
ncbi:aldolase/citrate lyase family protein [Gimesia sp.]|uniref:HpcH/HpaI aldolase family protein n=1 Tax=Gimesia sp. TaxID=2024833 RepID=UPI000C416C72|nr:aldolase/citrate lyase family protein [Gimesia sp.]MAX38322.1 aldolase [Gimesia sp.]HBL44768.1 aldolase [Planctomycetaceae bacterium]|tara:strand:+ start:8268 stop:9098 length:831 start_codon:yes stop_codon:yes gene_type:complete